MLVDLLDLVDPLEMLVVLASPDPLDSGLVYWPSSQRTKFQAVILGVDSKQYISNIGCCWFFTGSPRKPWKLWTSRKGGTCCKYILNWAQIILNFLDSFT